MPSESRHVSEYIDRAPEDVYAFASDPANLPAWAAGLGPADRVVFAPRNEFGVLDHVVTTASGQTVTVPMRVTPDGDGAEVVFTVRRLPGMTDADLDRDVGLVAADLATLKRLLESEGDQQPLRGGSQGDEYAHGDDDADEPEADSQDQGAPRESDGRQLGGQVALGVRFVVPAGSSVEDMRKQWQCRLGWHAWLPQHDADPQVCRGCGKRRRRRLGTATNLGGPPTGASGGFG